MTLAGLEQRPTAGELPVAGRLPEQELHPEFRNTRDHPRCRLPSQFAELAASRYMADWPTPSEPEDIEPSSAGVPATPFEPGVATQPEAAVATPFVVAAATPFVAAVARRFAAEDASRTVEAACSMQTPSES